jgi:hypothetical protein
MAISALSTFAGKTAAGSLTSDLILAAPLSPLLSHGGLRRGSVVGVSGTAATSLFLGFVVGPSQQGCWSAVAGHPALNLEAAEDLGIRLDHFVFVPRFGDSWLETVGVLIDTCEVIGIVLPNRCRPGEARRIMTRVRERQSVVVVMNSHRSQLMWPEAFDFEFSATEQTWTGLEHGYGALQSRQIEVMSTGRRSGGRERRTILELPTPLGGISAKATELSECSQDVTAVQLTG